MKELSGKTAVVTGGASGIGLAMAETFADAGMRVVLADIEAPALDAAVDRLEGKGVEAIGVVTDVSDIASMEALKAAADERFGAVHVVCNNAGVGGNADGSGGRNIDLADWKWVLEVNLWGVVHGHKVFLDDMISQGEGHIVNTSSMAGQFPGHGPYSASKWAVVCITEGLFHQLQGTGVGVSCLCPGWVRTQILDSARNRPEYAAPNALVDPESSSEAEARREFIREQIETGMPPAEVAKMVLDAIVDDTFWIFTDPTLVAALADRFTSVLENRNPSVFDLGESLTQTN